MIKGRRTEDSKVVEGREEEVLALYSGHPCSFVQSLHTMYLHHMCMCTHPVPSCLPRRATEAENAFSSPATCDEGGRAVPRRGPSVAPTFCGIHNRPHLLSMSQHHWGGIRILYSEQ